jgi:hypothetical protein
LTTEVTVPTIGSVKRKPVSDLVAVPPIKVVRRLGIPSGQHLEWIEDVAGSFPLVRQSTDVRPAGTATGQINAHYAERFRAPAK